MKNVLNFLLEQRRKISLFLLDSFELKKNFFRIHLKQMKYSINKFTRFRLKFEIYLYARFEYESANIFRQLDENTANDLVAGTIHPISPSIPLKTERIFDDRSSNTAFSIRNYPSQLIALYGSFHRRIV